MLEKSPDAVANDLTEKALQDPSKMSKRRMKAIHQFAYDGATVLMAGVEKIEPARQPNLWFRLMMTAFIGGISTPEFQKRVRAKGIKGPVDPAEAMAIMAEMPAGFFG